MQYGALDDALKTHCRLGIHFLVSRRDRGMRGDEVGQHLAQVLHIDAAGTQHLRRGCVVQHGEQQMFDRDELMTLLARLDERQMQTDFQFLCNHFSFPPCRIVTDVHAVLQTLYTCVTLVSATSREYTPHTAEPSLCTLSMICSSPFPIHRKKPLQHLDHKFHCGVIVIEQNHLVHARRLGFDAFRCEYQCRCGVWLP